MRECSTANINVGQPDKLFRELAQDCGLLRRTGTDLLIALFLAMLALLGFGLVIVGVYLPIN